MLDPSSLSVAARALRSHIGAAMSLPETQILIGHPNLTAGGTDGAKQFLNLFFYRVEHGAHPPDGTTDDPFYLRFYCLVTAFGAQETLNGTSISAGENDLRLVGGAMQGLHQNPILMLRDDSGEDIAQMQVVLHTLTLDDLNHIWSTQGDTPYRLSVGYELALLPLPLERAAKRGPRVGALGVELQVGTRYRPLPAAGLAAAALAPQVPAVRVDVERPDWAPHICWLAPGEALQYSMALASDALPASVQLIALGAPGSEVRLEWEIWDPAADPAWVPTPASPATLILETDRIDPAQTSPSFFSLADNVGFPLGGRSQALLYASRNYTRPDGAVVALRSNPLLVSVFQPGP